MKRNSRKTRAKRWDQRRHVAPRPPNKPLVTPDQHLICSGCTRCELMELMGRYLLDRAELHTAESATAIDLDGTLQMRRQGDRYASLLDAVYADGDSIEYDEEYERVGLGMCRQMLGAYVDAGRAADELPVLDAAYANHVHQQITLGCTLPEHCEDTEFGHRVEHRIILYAHELNMDAYRWRSQQNDDTLRLCDVVERFPTMPYMHQLSIADTKASEAMAMVRLLIREQSVVSLRERKKSGAIDDEQYTAYLDRLLGNTLWARNELWAVAKHTFRTPDSHMSASALETTMKQIDAEAKYLRSLIVTWADLVNHTLPPLVCGIVNAARHRDTFFAQRLQVMSGEVDVFSVNRSIERLMKRFNLGECVDDLSELPFLTSVYDDREDVRCGDDDTDPVLDGGDGGSDRCYCSECEKDALYSPTETDYSAYPNYLDTDDDADSSASDDGEDEFIDDEVDPAELELLRHLEEVGDEQQKGDGTPQPLPPLVTEPWMLSKNAARRAQRQREAREKKQQRRRELDKHPDTPLLNTTPRRLRNRIAKERCKCDHMEDEELELLSVMRKLCIVLDTIYKKVGAAAAAAHHSFAVVPVWPVANGGVARYFVNLFLGLCRLPPLFCDMADPGAQLHYNSVVSFSIHHNSPMTFASYLFENMRQAVAEPTTDEMECTLPRLTRYARAHYTNGRFGVLEAMRHVHLLHMHCEARATGRKLEHRHICWGLKLSENAARRSHAMKIIREHNDATSLAAINKKVIRELRLQQQQQNAVIVVQSGQDTSQAQEAAEAGACSGSAEETEVVQEDEDEDEAEPRAQQDL